MAQQYYTIYKITNLLDGKIYIGKHKTYDLNDGYMGSGDRVIFAQTKYGIENFKKEILFVFDNEQEMNDKERELVTAEFVAEKTNYNIAVGGKGGFPLNASPKGNAAKKQKRNEDPEWWNDYQVRRSAAVKIARQGLPGTFTGKTHTEETKQRLRRPRPQTAGEYNSQFGTRWITNGNKNVKLGKEEMLPIGWWYGQSSTPNLRGRVDFCIECRQHNEDMKWWNLFVASGKSIRAFAASELYPYSRNSFQNLKKRLKK